MLSQQLLAGNFKPKGFTMNGFSRNQIVYGVRCGKFVVLGFRQIGTEWVADVKEVKPNGKTGRGELSFPLDCIQSAPSKR